MFNAIVVPKTKYDRVVEVKNDEINNLKKKIEDLEADNKLKTNKLNEITYKLNSKHQELSKALLKNHDLRNEIEDKNREIFVIRTLLMFEADKTIKRYENIKKRTKKARVRKKCEHKIQDYMMRQLAYERE